MWTHCSALSPLLLAVARGLLEALLKGIRRPLAVRGSAPRKLLDLAVTLGSFQGIYSKRFGCWIYGHLPR